MSDHLHEPSKSLQLFRRNEFLEENHLPAESVESRARDSVKCLMGKSLAAFFERWFAEPLTLSDLKHRRVPVAWRIFRALAYGRGFLNMPTDTVQSLPITEVLLPTHFGARESADPILNELVRSRALPLMPPDVPEEFLLESVAGQPREVDEDYRPDGDLDLRQWCRQIKRVSQLLGIDRTEKGRQGLLGLHHASIARAAWPTYAEIVAYENKMIRDTFDKLIEDKTAEVERWLSSTHELTDAEARQVLMMAKVYGREMMAVDDLKGMQSLILARLEREMERLTEAGDSGRGRSIILKEMWRIASYRQEGQDDDLSDMNDVVDAVVVQRKAQNRKELAAKSPDR